VLGEATSLRDADQAATLKSDLEALARKDPSAFRDALQSSLGEKLSANETDQLLADIAGGDIDGPEVQFVDAGALSGDAYGAYSRENGGTIFLDRHLVGDKAQLERVFAEEFGHHLDNVVGGADAAGDEGAIFSQSLFNGPLDGRALTALQGENDFGSIVVAGREVLVEFHGGGGADSGQASGDGGGGTESDGGGGSGAGGGGADSGGAGSASEGAGAGGTGGGGADTGGAAGSECGTGAAGAGNGGGGQSGVGSLDAAAASTSAQQGQTGGSSGQSVTGSQGGPPGTGSGGSGESSAYGGSGSSGSSGGSGGTGETEGAGGSSDGSTDEQRTAIDSVTGTPASELARVQAENGLGTHGNPFGGDAGRDGGDPPERNNRSRGDSAGDTDSLPGGPDDSGDGLTPEQRAAIDAVTGTPESELAREKAENGPEESRGLLDETGKGALHEEEGFKALFYDYDVSALDWGWDFDQEKRFHANGVDARVEVGVGVVTEEFTLGSGLLTFSFEGKMHNASAEAKAFVDADFSALKGELALGGGANAELLNGKVGATLNLTGKTLWDTGVGLYNTHVDPLLDNAFGLDVPEPGLAPIEADVGLVLSGHGEAGLGAALSGKGILRSRGRVAEFAVSAKGGTFVTLGAGASVGIQWDPKENNAEK